VRVRVWNGNVFPNCWQNLNRWKQKHGIRAAQEQLGGWRVGGSQCEMMTSSSWESVGLATPLKCMSTLLLLCFITYMYLYGLWTLTLDEEGPAGNNTLEWPLCFSPNSSVSVTDYEWMNEWMEDLWKTTTNRWAFQFPSPIIIYPPTAAPGIYIYFALSTNVYWKFKLQSRFTLGLSRCCKSWGCWLYMYILCSIYS
jgi:hypothetical protein